MAGLVSLPAEIRLPKSLYCELILRRYPMGFRILGLVSRIGLPSALIVTTFFGAQAPGTPTFSKDVAPILYKNCVSCHRPGEMAPMSLMTYELARPFARSIRTRVELGSMPPWHAEAPEGTFLNE